MILYKSFFKRAIALTTQTPHRMVTDSHWCETLTANVRQVIVSCYEKNFVRKCLYDFYGEILKQ